MSTATPEVRLQSPVSDYEGYGRRFMAGTIAGRLVFGFTGHDREDRGFVINARFNTHGETEAETQITCQESDAARELIDILNDDASATTLALRATVELEARLAEAPSAV